jgi:hypothetical protein
MACDLSGWPLLRASGDTPGSTIQPQVTAEQHGHTTALRTRRARCLQRPKQAQPAPRPLRALGQLDSGPPFAHTNSISCMQCACCYRVRVLIAWHCAPLIKPSSSATAKRAKGGRGAALRLLDDLEPAGCPSAGGCMATEDE